MFYLPNYVFYIFLSPKGRTGSNKIFIGMPIIPLLDKNVLLCLDVTETTVTSILFSFNFQARFKHFLEFRIFEDLLIDCSI